MELKDKAALVTGASSGLGRAISLALAGEGANVALVARKEEKLRQVKEQIGSDGEALVVVADVSEAGQVEDAVKKTVEHFGGLDIIVNNAGLGIFDRVEKMSVADWDKHINVMLRGAFLVSKFALPHLYARGAGHVINISSLWAKRYCAKCAGYTAAKFGVRGLTQSMREEARQYNVKVTNVMPGTVKTPFFEKSNWEADLSDALMPEDVAQTVIAALKMPDRAVMEEIVIQSIRPGKCTD